MSRNDWDHEYRRGSYDYDHSDGIQLHPAGKRCV